MYTYNVHVLHVHVHVYTVTCTVYIARQWYKPAYVLGSVSHEGIEDRNVDQTTRQDQSCQNCVSLPAVGEGLNSINHHCSRGGVKRHQPLRAN